MRASRVSGVSAVRRSEQKHRATGGINVLAERTQAVVAVGAWVEGGLDFLQHPSALASQTEELQAEKMRENEQNLLRFQDKVRCRLAQQAQFSKKIELARSGKMVECGRTIQQAQHAEQEPLSASPQRELHNPSIHPDCQGFHRDVPRRRVTMETNSQETSKDMRQVRDRLAACRMIPDGETISDLPGGQWNVSVTRHAEEEEQGDDPLHTSQHDCPLIQQNINEYPALRSGNWPPPSMRGLELNNIEEPPSDSCPRVLQVLWPLTDQDQEKRQSHFLMHRRHFMNMEREQVKENKCHRKHLKRTARIKGEKEQIRQKEEKKLEGLYQSTEARRKIEERELLILERLRVEEEEEEEEKAEEQQRPNKTDKEKEAVRLMMALRAQIKMRVSLEKLDLPPLCYCASSFWDSHPDTCANNCTFHNNPKVYLQALHSAVLNLDLQ
ncbi:coiled-coil domain-containing protein 15 [Genypterus blacodes]|uniref:coiled-coil domain-containing protein 15 n=1 Tax=Genypterus blacodes TaxID=154954 RepID=UPI003F767B18